LNETEVEANRIKKNETLEFPKPTGVFKMKKLLNVTLGSEFYRELLCVVYYLSKS